jgi:ketosteroid isomerase-like protein
LAYQVEDVVAASGGRVVVAYRMTAEHDGHPIELRGVMRLWVSGGAVARRVDYWDGMTFLRQTGQR